MVNYKLLDELVAPVEDMLNETGIEEREQAEELIEHLASSIMSLLPIQNQSDRDNVAMAFASMVFILNRYDLESMVESDEIDKVYEDIFDKIEDENLVKYLKLISSDLLGLATLNEAIEMEPTCAIAYYLKGVILLSDLNSIEDLKSFDAEVRDDILSCIDNMRELGFLLYKEFYTEGLVTIYHDFIGNREDFNLDIILAILKYEQELSDKNKWNAAYENYVKMENINWEQANNLVLDFFGKTIYDELSKYDDIMHVVKSGEYFWHTNIERVRKLAHEEKGSVDLTSLAVSYFKVVEMYLFEKIFELGKNQQFSYFSSTGKVEQEISESTYNILRNNSTIGNYKWFINNNRTLMLRYPKNNELAQNLTKRIQIWADQIRNSKLHKNNIKHILELEMVKNETKKLLGLLVVNLK